MTSNKPLSDRRLVENEAVFRKYNEKAVNGLSELGRLAEEHGQHSMRPKQDQNLLFYCECSDEECVKRINLTVDKYQSIHKDRRCFVIETGHDQPRVEQVIDGTADYSVVCKYDDPPENPGHVQRTDARSA